MIVPKFLIRDAEQAMSSARSRDLSSWYVVQTQPRKEALAAEHLKRQEFVSFWPRFRKTVSHARRRSEILSSLFPGYLFVRLNLASGQWRRINSTIGVRSLVGVRDAAPSAMPDEVMQEIIGRCDGGIAKSVLGHLSPGRQVRLVSGPFASHLARIVELDDYGRVHVLLSLLGQENVLRVKPSLLGPV